MRPQPLHSSRSIKERSVNFAARFLVPAPLRPVDGLCLETDAAASLAEFSGYRRDIIDLGSVSEHVIGASL